MSTATIRLYDQINRLGGSWGISSRDIGALLDGLDDDVDSIVLRINSPGGEVTEALAILNLLRSHPAHVTAVVDGVAASSASFIAAGVDELVMSPQSELMIHDARAAAVGSATFIQKIADLLEHESDNIAAVYAEKSGGTKADWRALMTAETWLSDEEALAAKLADRIDKVPVTKALNGGPVAEPDVMELFASFDFTVFNYAGRAKAPPPRIPGAPNPPAASAGGSTPTQEGSPAVAFSDEQLTTMRQQLGVAEDADETTILAALTEALAEQATSAPPAASNTPPAAPAAPTPPAAPAAPTAPVVNAQGTITLDAGAWEEQQNRIKRLEAADVKRRVEERDTVIAQAVKDGKFPAARREVWTNLWDADPEGTRQVIAGLTKNVVPVMELGHASDEDEFDEELSHLYPPKGA